MTQSISPMTDQTNPGRNQPTSSAQLIGRGPVLLGLAVAIGLFVISRYNYLLFHGLVEIYSVVIAFAIFIVAWNSQEHVQNPYLSIIGVAYLFIGFLDLLHTLSYKGMGVFTDYDFYANQLWIATRFLESVTLLVGFLFLKIKLRPNLHWVAAVYAAITALIVITTFLTGSFPVCFIAGVGLTPFKIISEYVICGILLAGIMFLVKLRDQFHHRIYLLLLISMLATIGSELAFTFYVSNYDLSNLVGHYFKLLSFYLIYKAIVQTGIRDPYELVYLELRAKEEELERLALMDDLTGMFNRRATFRLLNKTLHGAQRQNRQCTVCYMDLDGFKAVNDRFGHRAGDQILIRFAEAVKETVREMDYGCRLGGDEFLIIFPNCHQESALVIVERIRQRLQDWFDNGRCIHAVNFSYGLAEYAGQGEVNVDRLVEVADRRMLQRKTGRRNNSSATTV